MALIGDGRGGSILRQLSTRPERVAQSWMRKSDSATFDVVLTNPPFGKKIVVKGVPNPVAI